MFDIYVYTTCSDQLHSTSDTEHETPCPAIKKKFHRQSCLISPHNALQY